MKVSVKACRDPRGSVTAILDPGFFFGFVALGQG
jgi:hypothetical protein